MKNKTLPENRRPKLLKLLSRKSYIRTIEAHNGISALIGEKANYNGKEFDAIWISSLTDSVAKGYPDEEIVSIDSRLKTIDQIVNVTSKPLIYDADTGGFPEQLNYLVKQLEYRGVSAIVIEDKKYPKSNSLLKDAKHELESIPDFIQKLKFANESKKTDDFLVIARIESLIINAGMKEAVKRAKAYLPYVDGIMIHSKKENPEDIYTFSEEYNKMGYRKYLMCVPTTYNTEYEVNLSSRGFNIILYANHMLRSSALAMKLTCEEILKNERSFESNKRFMDIKELLDYVDSFRSYMVEYSNEK